MNFSIINLRSINREPPSGWKKTGYGYFQMDKVVSQVKKDRDIQTHKFEVEPALKGEGFVEQQFFLNILRTLNGDVTLMELGAGRGDWCLALSGIVDFSLIDHKINSYKCFAVEAEPIHYEWIDVHFKEQNINAVAINCAVSSYNGVCKFYAKENPADHYGQCIHEEGNIVVPCHTLDYLVDEYGIEKIDLLHVDIQGTEYDMLFGATETLKRKKIKNMMIGMHRPEFNQQIIDFVKPYDFEPLFSVKVASGVCETPFGRAVFPVDGLMVLSLCND